MSNPETKSAYEAARHIIGYLGENCGLKFSNVNQRDWDVITRLAASACAPQPEAQDEPVAWLVAWRQRGECSRAFDFESDAIEWTIRLRDDKRCSGIEIAPLYTRPSQGGEAREERRHRVMTAAEYIETPIVGWHQVCRNIDGFNNVGVRYLGASAPPAPVQPASGQDR